MQYLTEVGGITPGDTIIKALYWSNSRLISPRVSVNLNWAGDLLVCHDLVSSKINDRKIVRFLFKFHLARE